MKVKRLFLATLAGAGVSLALPAQGSQFNQVSMCVTTAIGTCGNFCQPAECDPNYTLVSSHENMVVDVAGAPESSYVLFFGVAAPGCLQVPGVAGQLATWRMAAPLAFGSFDSSNLRPGLICQPAADTHIVSFPAIPAGIDLRFQMLGINEYNTQPTLTFSRPVEVRTR